jgi:hypothetical protein
VGASGRNVSPVSATIWNSESTGANTTSAKSLQIANSAYVSCFGHVNNATTITAMVSADGLNWYGGPSQTLGSASDFCIHFAAGCGWVALQSSSNVTATAIVSAKDS